MNRASLRIAAIASASILLYACGGGGGGGGAPPPPPPSPATVNSATGATQAALSVLGFAQSAQQLTKADGLAPGAGSGFAFRALAMFNSLRGGPSGSSFKALLAPQQCLFGGTVDDQTDPLTGFGTITFTDCVDVRDTVAGVEFFLNGSITFTGTENSLTVTFGAFTTGERTFPGGVLLFKDTLNGTFAFSFSAPRACGAGFVVDSVTMSLNATDAFFEDADGNEVAEFDDVSSASNLVINVTQQFGPEPNCTLVGDTLTVNGGVANDDKLNDLDDLSATFTNLVAVATFALDGSATVTLNGTVTLVSACENGTFTINTEVPLFFPATAEDDCPTTGKVLVSAGGVTVAVIFGGAEGVDVDAGNDGTIEQHFLNCEDAGACSAA